MLKDNAYLSSPKIPVNRIPARNGLAVYFNLTLRGASKTCQKVQQRAFAGTGFACNHGSFTGIQSRVDML
jgi:hypothetical protein